MVIQVGKEVIRADLFDATEHILYEAKASPDRQKLRMAIGQLLDYERFVRPQPRLRVLLPGQPSPDLQELLVLTGIGFAWPDQGGWRCSDPAAPISEVGRAPTYARLHEQSVVLAGFEPNDRSVTKAITNFTAPKTCKRSSCAPVRAAAHLHGKRKATMLGCDLEWLANAGVRFVSASLRTSSRETPAVVLRPGWLSDRSVVVGQAVEREVSLARD
jgi:hypothetical protein